MSNKEPSLTLDAGPYKLLVIPTSTPKSSIYTGADEEAKTQGIIVSAGCSMDSTWLGKEVIFKKFAGHSFSFQGDAYIVLEAGDVLVSVR